MKFTLEIECDNAAFEDNPADEVARILGVLIEEIIHEPQPGPWPLHDTNGNTVGYAAFHPGRT